MPMLSGRKKRAQKQKRSDDVLEERKTGKNPTKATESLEGNFFWRQPKRKSVSVRLSSIYQ
jgi:hypothetical protein